MDKIKNRFAKGYEAVNDQPKELQDALGSLDVTGDTLKLEYLKDQLNVRIGATALEATRDDFELAA